MFNWVIFWIALLIGIVLNWLKPQFHVNATSVISRIKNYYIIVDGIFVKYRLKIFLGVCFISLLLVTETMKLQAGYKTALYILCGLGLSSLILSNEELQDSIFVKFLKKYASFMSYVFVRGPKKNGQSIGVLTMYIGAIFILTFVTIAILNIGSSNPINESILRLFELGIALVSAGIALNAIQMAEESDQKMISIKDLELNEKCAMISVHIVTIEKDPLHANLERIALDIDSTRYLKKWMSPDQKKLVVDSITKLIQKCDSFKQSTTYATWRKLKYIKFLRRLEATLTSLRRKDTTTID